MLRNIFIVLSLFTISIPFSSTAKDYFFLESEVRSNYSDGENFISSMSYEYDQNGHRIAKRAYDNIGSIAPLTTRLLFKYDGNNQIYEELLLLEGYLFAKIQYSFNENGNVTSIVSLRKNGIVRFRDELVYDSENRVSEEKRFRGETVEFYHRYSYDFDGRLASDTLFEPYEVGYIPTQVVLFSYNTKDQVSSEKKYLRFGGTWFHIATMYMTYKRSLLSGITEIERYVNGQKKTGRYSFSFEYDRDGNRIREKRFDSLQRCISETEYSWYQSNYTYTMISPQLPH